MSISLQQPPLSRDNDLQPDTPSEHNPQNTSSVEPNLIHHKQNHSSDTTVPVATPHSNSTQPNAFHSDVNEINSYSVQDNVSTTHDIKNESNTRSEGGDSDNSVVKRKQSLCLPTVSLPHELQTTLKKVLAGESL